MPDASPHSGTNFLADFATNCQSNIDWRDILPNTRPNFEPDSIAESSTDAVSKRCSDNIAESGTEQEPVGGAIRIPVGGAHRADGCPDDEPDG